MTADSVPAPMVPAELKRIIAECEGAIARENVLGEQVVTVRWLKEQLEPLVDAATPAASVPAADILALADNLDEWASSWLITEVVEKSRRELAADILTKASAGVRALVAAAEQADKGEAADTPRDEGLCRNVTGRPESPICERCAPAVPVGKLAPFDLDRLADARVPVNDEAEAAWQAWWRDFNAMEDTEARSKMGYVHHFKAGWGTRQAAVDRMLTIADEHLHGLKLHGLPLPEVLRRAARQGGNSDE